MKHKDPLDERKCKIAHTLSRLPRKILSLYGRDDVAEFVLHELAQRDCFNLERAAYVVDNPDFNCLKGIAGFNRLEVFNDDAWNDPEQFSRHMYASKYNNKVRAFECESCVKNGVTDDEIVSAISNELEMKHPLYYAWNMKHNNRGILLYEKQSQDACDCDYMLEGLCLIGFCPVF